MPPIYAHSARVWEDLLFSDKSEEYAAAILINALALICSTSLGIAGTIDLYQHILAHNVDSLHALELRNWSATEFDY
jgi:hypothetical protein